MAIKAGEKIGVCGRTGSGKSSLILSLVRLLDQTSGSLTIDGVDLSKVPRHIIRSHLIALPQDAIKLAGSVRFNLNPEFSDISDDSLISILSKVHLWDDISPRGGLDVEVSDLNLSHGQQQLFSLAYAILRRQTTNAHILLLDEATSSVDTQTDTLMQDLIRKEFEGCTVIAVAHRLTTIADFDRVAVLDKGNLIEFDTPKALLRREGSAFKTLRESQH